MKRPKVLWAVFGLPFIICFKTKREAIKEMGTLREMVPSVKNSISGPHKYIVEE